MASTPKKRARLQRTQKLIEAPDTLNVIVMRISSGETLVDVTRSWDVPYSKIAAWLEVDDSRREQYQKAVQTREQNHKDRIVTELVTMLGADITGAFDQNGNLLPINQIPDSVRRCIAGIEFTDAGVAHRIRFHDKLKGIEILARSLRMLTDRTELSLTKPTLADLLSDAKPTTPALPAGTVEVVE